MHDQFGRYILLERIAIGGMAEIFRAKAPGLGGFEKVLAIKRLHPRYSQDADFIEMLIDEARITVELSHSNIGQIFDLGKVDDHYFIAMEFIDGRDLYRVMKRMRERRQMFPFDAAAHVAMEACAGLDYAHRKKDNRGRPLHIIHRDVSPQNVLLSFEGEVKLVDFGIAKAALRAYETESGIIKGKFYYMSPEQARGEHLDHRTDVFSLGIVLYEMLTGDLLYKDDDEVTLLSRVRRAEIAPPSALRPEIPDQLERVVMRALARDREERYPSALHFQRDLQRYLRDAGTMFNKARLGQLMREVFGQENEADEQGSLDGELLRDRNEFVLDRESVIPVASFEDGEDPTAIDPSMLDEDGSTVDGGAFESGLMELSADDIELVEDGAPMPEFGAAPAGIEDYDSIAGDGLYEHDPFESEETRTFTPDPRHRPEARDRKPAREVRIRPEPSAEPAGLRAPDPVPFAERPTPVPAPAPAVKPRSNRPSPRPVPRAMPEPAAEAPRMNRRPTVIVPLEKSKEGAAPRRGGRPGDTPAVRRVVGGEAAEWLTRERIIMGAILFAVVVLAAVVTSALTGDDEDEKPAVVASSEPAEVVGMGTPQATADTATLHLTSYPSGADVKVDGKWLAHESTPTRYEVPSGRAVPVRIALAGYTPYDTEVTLKAGAEQKVHARLERLKGTLTVETKPSGATVFVDGKEMGRTPMTATDVAVDKPARLRITKDGFETHEKTVEWGEDREKTVEIELEPVEVDPPVVAERKPERKPARRRTRRRARRSEPRPARRPSPRRERRPARRAANNRDAQGGDGYISVTARRWGSVFLNGTQIAMETPLIKYKVPAGTHEIYVCYGGDRSNRSQVKRINVSRGRTTLIKF